jgi:hypothetical protein
VRFALVQHQPAAVLDPRMRGRVLLATAAGGPA